MFITDGVLNGFPVRAEIDVPRLPRGEGWLSAVVVCQNQDRFIVWSVYRSYGEIVAENGTYDIESYARALELALARASGALAR